jgi:hypothetical protein
MAFLLLTALGMTRNQEPSDSDHTSRRQSSPGDDPIEGSYSGDDGRGYGGDGNGDDNDEYDDRERRPSTQPHRDDRDDADDRDDDGDIDIDPDIMEVLDNNDLEQMDGPDA